MSANNFYSMQKRLLFKTDYVGKILQWGREGGGLGVGAATVKLAQSPVHLLPLYSPNDNGSTRTLGVKNQKHLMQKREMMSY